MLKEYYKEGVTEAGCDEAGRGCLAGSVYAAAVIFPAGYTNEELNDSKQLTDRRRKRLREIIERDALAWAVGIVTPEPYQHPQRYNTCHAPRPRHAEGKTGVDNR